MTDQAKNTIKQTTENTQYIGPINNADNNNYVIDYNDTARNTIKQTTELTEYIGHANDNNGNYTIDYKDITKPTIKQTTLINNNIIGFKNDISNITTYLTEENVSIDDRKEKTTYNRPANGRKDAHGPYLNEDTVELNNPLLYSYTPNPLKSINIIPDRCKYNYKTDTKVVLQPDTYYINNNFISTLESNPLVNDIYHTKNY